MGRKTPAACDYIGCSSRNDSAAQTRELGMRHILVQVVRDDWRPGEDQKYNEYVKPERQDIVAVVRPEASMPRLIADVRPLT